MDHRQLVLDTINHREREVIPFHLDLTEEVRLRLIDYFQDEDFEREVGNSLLLCRNESFTPVDEKRKRDMFGVLWLSLYEGDFGVVEEYQLKDPDLSNYTFPEPDREEIQERCQWLVKEGPHMFTMYTIGFSLFERAWTLRGMEDFLMDLICHPRFVEELLDGIVEYNLKVIDIVKEYPIDAIFFGDDWGEQRGLIMGPHHWRRFIGPYLKRMYQKAKEEGFFVAQHSCGNIQEIFGDLVEMGMDIYNTFQPEVFHVEKMKREFGPYVTFYGGISTQRLLPVASVEEIKKETRRLMRLLGEGGGYIVAPTHAIPGDVPTEAILAFLEVVQNQTRR